MGYVRVDWVDDEAFEMDRQRVIEMRDTTSMITGTESINFLFHQKGLINTINKL